MAWDGLAQTYANLGWVGEGEGYLIAGIADIARHSRDRKAKTSPLGAGTQRTAEIEDQNIRPRKRALRQSGIGLGCRELSTLES